jgi:hypothetical protein
MLLKLANLFFICLISFQLQAQIVNIEAKRVNLSDTTAVYGQLNLGFNLVENGNSIISINGGANIEFVKKKHWFLILTNYNFFQAGKEGFVNDGFLHFRYNYQLNKYLTYESFTQAQYNEKLNLRLRWLLGTGLRLTLLKKEKQDAHLGLSYMYEYNEENDPEREFRDHRMSSYLSFSFKVFPNAKISNTTYYQPVLNEFTDLRLSSQTALLINFTSKLLFTSTFNITYDSRVPGEVENTFYSFRNGIRWKF